MKNIWKLLVGTPILRYNAHLDTWQRFTTTVEVEYPEDGVDCRYDPPWWIRQDSAIKGFLGIEERGLSRLAFIHVASQKYPEILVATIRMRIFPDLSTVDWDEIMRALKKDIKDNEATQWNFNNWKKPFPDEIKKQLFSSKYEYEFKIEKKYLYNPIKGVVQ